MKVSRHFWIRIGLMSLLAAPLPALATTPATVVDGKKATSAQKGKAAPKASPKTNGATDRDFPELASQITKVKEEMSKLTDIIIKEAQENSESVQQNIRETANDIHEKIDKLRPAVEKLSSEAEKQQKKLAPAIDEIRTQTQAIRDKLDSEEWRITARRLTEQTRDDLAKLSEELEELRYELSQAPTAPAPDETPSEAKKKR